MRPPLGAYVTETDDYTAWTVKMPLKPASTSSSEMSVSIARMRNRLPLPTGTISPTVQFGAALAALPGDPRTARSVLKRIGARCSDEVAKRFEAKAPPLGVRAHGDLDFRPNQHHNRSQTCKAAGEKGVGTCGRSCSSY
jgi:hypothetical protein